MQLLRQHLLTWFRHLDFKLEGKGRYEDSLQLCCSYSLPVVIGATILPSCAWHSLTLFSFTVRIQYSINSYLLFCFFCFTSLIVLECIQFVLFCHCYPQQLALCLAHFEHFSCSKKLNQSVQQCCRESLY